MVRVTEWVRKGSIWIRETDSTALLAPQKSSSFLADFEFSVNHLSGCPFGCAACYVKALGSVKFRRDRLPDGQATSAVDAWGKWVEVRTRSVEILAKALDRGKLDGARLFMTPVSDCYWPGERNYELTRRMLELLAQRQVFDWLLISTRSKLILRDLDVLQQLGNKVEVGISIPTDREDVKRVLQPQNPSIEFRFEAAQRLMRAGIPTRIHVAPLEQPYTQDFPARLAEAAHWVWIDWHYHLEAGFEPIYAANGWKLSTPADAQAFADRLQARMGSARVRVGQPYFANRWSHGQGQVVVHHRPDDASGELGSHSRGLRAGIRR